MDDLDPDQIRSRTFSQARRGYDRSEVDAFRDLVADQVAALAGELDALQSRLKQLGLEDPQDLKQEFDAVGAEVQAVLQAARRAAEEMRSRASTDAARWRNEADQESRELRDDAQDVSTALRTSAWETGVEMLDQVKESAADIIRVAEQDALFIRAEAERETLRMTADARRDAEEERRSARTEAERTLLDARADSESILASARQSAEAAQERARALEERRAELMKELESARESIGQMEQEIDSRREALYMAGVNEPSGMRVITPDPATPEWNPDEAGVRVVPRARLMSGEPVDADAMADEVRLMRSGDVPPDDAPAPDHVLSEHAADAAAEQPTIDDADTDPADGAVDEAPADVAPAEAMLPVLAAPPPPSPPQSPAVMTPAVSDGPPEPEVPESAIPEPAAPEPGEPEPGEPEPGEPEPGEPEPGEPEPGEPEPGEPEPAAPEPETPEPIVSDVPADPDREVSPVAADGADDLSGLFASLRTGRSPRQEPVAPPASAERGDPAGEPAVTNAAQPVPDSVPTAVTAERGSAMDASSSAFELRDRLLLPIQNRALRAVKRRLVDLQNRVLEELRVDGVDWEPEAAMFRASLADELTPVRREAFIAGFTAAAELHGNARSPAPTGSVPHDAVPDFVGGLLEAISEALHRARASHSGTRQASSAVSKVFRAWRTDEAERRVRWSARAAYHRGVAGGLAALGAPLVTSVASGRLCAACPGCTTQSWDPAEWSSPSAPIPPATSECSATIVPAGSTRSE